MEYINKLKELKLSLIVKVMLVLGLGVCILNVFSILYAKMSLYELASVDLTFGTLIVIIYTLLELKNQRETIYKQILFLKVQDDFIFTMNKMVVLLIYLHYGLVRKSPKLKFLVKMLLFMNLKD